MENTAARLGHTTYRPTAVAPRMTRRLMMLYLRLAETTLVRSPGGVSGAVDAPTLPVREPVRPARASFARGERSARGARRKLMGQREGQHYGGRGGAPGATAEEGGGDRGRRPMSGLVAVVSRDEACASGAWRGPAGCAACPLTTVWSATPAACAWACAASAARPSIAGAGRAGEPLAALAGEILNAASLARELGAPPGEQLRGAGPRAVRGLGPGLFHHLEGAFALVVVDAGRERVLAGSDPYGVKALYHVTLGEDVLLGTEAKTFAADPRFVAAADETAVASVLATGHDMSRALFAGVHALREGRLLEVEHGRAREVTHWSARESVGRLRGEAYIDGLADAMQGPVLAPCTPPTTCCCPSPAAWIRACWARLAPIPRAGDGGHLRRRRRRRRCARRRAGGGPGHAAPSRALRACLPGRTCRRHAVAHPGPPAADGEHHRLPDGGLPAAGPSSAASTRAWAGASRRAAACCPTPASCAATTPAWPAGRCLLRSLGRHRGGGRGAVRRRRPGAATRRACSPWRGSTTSPRASPAWTAPTCYMVSGRARSWRCAGLGLAGTLDARRARRSSRAAGSTRCWPARPPSAWTTWRACVCCAA